MRSRRLSVDERRVLKAAHACLDKLAARSPTALLANQWREPLATAGAWWCGSMKAAARGWLAAAAAKRRKITSLLRRFDSDQDISARIIRDLASWRAMTTVRQIYDDIMALYDDPVFTAVAVDPRGDVSATTDEIVVRGVNFGRFRIRLHDLADPAYWRVRAEATTPLLNRCAVELTHPHVWKSIVCLGKAESAVRAAWYQGRIYDYFCIVARVLNTYSPDTAYQASYVWFNDTDDRRVARCAVCEDPLSTGDYELFCAVCLQDICESCVAAVVGGRAICANCYEEDHAGAVRGGDPAIAAG